MIQFNISRIVNYRKKIIVYIRIRTSAASGGADYRVLFLKSSKSPVPESFSSSPALYGLFQICTDSAHHIKETEG